MRVTRDDVARAAGVSPAVVSYVVNDGPRPVSAGARERVERAMAELGWRPDRNAQNLRRRRTDLLGLVVPNLAMPYVAELTEHIAREAARTGMRLVVASSGWSLETERLQIADMVDARVAGLLLMSVDPSQPFEELAHVGVPVLVIDRPTISSEGTAALVTHLASHGRRRIGFVGAEAGLVGADRRHRAWADALEALGLEPPVGADVRLGVEPSIGARVATRIASGELDVDALYFELDHVALAFLHAAHGLGIAVPDDVAIASFEGSASSALAVPGITTLRQPIARLASSAVAAALAPDGDAVRLITDEEVVLVLRDSCGRHDS